MPPKPRVPIGDSQIANGHGIFSARAPMPAGLRHANIGAR